MPTYEYQCSACGHQFEEFQKITDDPLTKCPNCHENKVKRLISATAFHLKGSGWYKTDYGNSGSSATTGADSSSKPKESKTDSSSTEKPAEKKSEKKEAKSEAPSKTSDSKAS